MAHKYTFGEIEYMRAIVRRWVGNAYYAISSTNSNSLKMVSVDVDSGDFQETSDIWDDIYYPEDNKDRVQFDVLTETTLQTYINAGVSPIELFEGWDFNHNSNSPHRHYDY